MRHDAASGSRPGAAEYSTYRWLLEPLLSAAGFEIADVSYERRLYGSYTCVRR